MLLRVSLIFIFIGIAYLSLTPTDTITIGNDKISHFIAYGSLMFNFGLITYPKMKKFSRAIVISVSYGVLMEIGQYFVPGRFMSFYDIVANILGVSLGVTLILLLGKTIQGILRRAKII